MKRVSEFFEKIGIPYEAVTDMYKRQWEKFMLNVGVNQTVAVYRSNYGEIQKEGESRNTMISAIKKVIDLSESAGIDLTVANLNYWLEVLSKLNQVGKQSMSQDMEARRYSEVELFAGEIL